MLRMRKNILVLLAGFLSVFLLSGCSDQATPPKSIPTQNIVETQSANQVAETQPAVEEEEEIKNESIAFETINQNDPTLDKGLTKVKQEGLNGTKELKYKVTYTDGNETSRSLISETIKTQPVDKIVLNGTKEKPIVNTYSTCGEEYYVNVDGNCVHRPSSNPSGATAKCRDGSYSYSQNRSGTCSRHGGVAEWL